MSEFLSWDGYGLAGMVLSALGAMLTVFFSVKASKAATSAEIAAAEAASQAKNTLLITNSIAELQKLESILGSMKLNIENEEWDKCARSCSQVHVISARLKNQQEIFPQPSFLTNIEFLHAQSLKLEEEFLTAYEKQNLKNKTGVQILVTTFISKVAEVSESFRGNSNELSTK